MRREAIQVRIVAIAVLNLRMNFSRCMPNYRPDGPHRGQWGLICPPFIFGIPYINPIPIRGADFVPTWFENVPPGLN